MVVYTLLDPNTNVVRYIGITRHTAVQRLSVHIKDAKTKLRKHEYLSKKEKWMLDLIRNKQKPIVETTYDNVSEKEAIRIEQELIALYGRYCEGGQLFNVQEGGDYDCCKAKVWNKNVKNCYTTAEIKINRAHQPNKKRIYRFTKNGEFVDSWESIRYMCDQLHFDRRTVCRCLECQENFRSHKGFQFSYTKTAPVYINKSTLKTYENSPHAKPIIAIKDGSSYDFRSIKEASETLQVPSALISAVLIGQQHTSHGYIFKYK